MGFLNVSELQTIFNLTDANVSNIHLAYVKTVTVNCYLFPFLSPGNKDSIIIKNSNFKSRWTLHHTIFQHKLNPITGCIFSQSAAGWAQISTHKQINMGHCHLWMWSYFLLDQWQSTRHCLDIMANQITLHLWCCSVVCQYSELKVWNASAAMADRYSTSCNLIVSKTSVISVTGQHHISLHGMFSFRVMRKRWIINKW